MNNSQDIQTLSLDDAEDLTLYADEEFDTDDIDLFEFTSLDDTPLTLLKSIVLSLDWEITPEILQELIDETLNLQESFAEDQVVLVYLQGLEKLSRYVQSELARAHHNAIKLLATYYYNLEQIISSPDITNDEISNLLKMDVRKFKILQYQINSTKKDDSTSDETEPAETTLEIVPDEAQDTLRGLNASILELEWEITDSGLNTFFEQTKLLEKEHTSNKYVSFLASGLLALGTYISDEGPSAHPEAFSILHSFYASVVTILAQETDEEQIKQMVVSCVSDLNNLKAYLAEKSKDSEQEIISENKHDLSQEFHEADDLSISTEEDDQQVSQAYTETKTSDATVADDEYFFEDKTEEKKTKEDDFWPVNDIEIDTEKQADGDLFFEDNGSDIDIESTVSFVKDKEEVQPALVGIPLDDESDEIVPTEEDLDIDIPSALSDVDDETALDFAPASFSDELEINDGEDLDINISDELDSQFSNFFDSTEESIDSPESTTQTPVLDDDDTVTLNSSAKDKNEAGEFLDLLDDDAIFTIDEEYTPSITLSGPVTDQPKDTLLTKSSAEKESDIASLSDISEIEELAPALEGADDSLGFSDSELHEDIAMEISTFFSDDDEDLFSASLTTEDAAPKDDELANDVVAEISMESDLSENEEHLSPALSDYDDEILTPALSDSDENIASSPAPSQDDFEATTPALSDLDEEIEFNAKETQSISDNQFSSELNENLFSFFGDDASENPFDDDTNKNDLELSFTDQASKDSPQDKPGADLSEMVDSLFGDDDKNALNDDTIALTSEEISFGDLTEDNQAASSTEALDIEFGLDELDIDEEKSDTPISSDSLFENQLSTESKKDELTLDEIDASLEFQDTFDGAGDTISLDSGELKELDLSGFSDKQPEEDTIEDEFEFTDEDITPALADSDEVAEFSEEDLSGSISEDDSKNLDLKLDSYFDDAETPAAELNLQGDEDITAEEDMAPALTGSDEVSGFSEEDLSGSLSEDDSKDLDLKLDSYFDDAETPAAELNVQGDEDITAEEDMAPALADSDEVSGFNEEDLSGSLSEDDSKDLDLKLDSYFDDVETPAAELNVQGDEDITAEEDMAPALADSNEVSGFSEEDLSGSLSEDDSKDLDLKLDSYFDDAETPAAELNLQGDEDITAEEDMAPALADSDEVAGFSEEDLSGSLSEDDSKDLDLKLDSYFDDAETPVAELASQIDDDIITEDDSTSALADNDEIAGFSEEGISDFLSEEDSKDLDMKLDSYFENDDTPVTAQKIQEFGLEDDVAVEKDITKETDHISAPALTTSDQETGFNAAEASEVVSEEEPEDIDQKLDSYFEAAKISGIEKDTSLTEDIGAEIVEQEVLEDDIALETAELTQEKTELEINTHNLYKELEFCIKEIIDNPKSVHFEEGSELLNKISDIPEQDSQKFALIQLMDSAFSLQPRDCTQVSDQTTELFNFLIQNILTDKETSHQDTITTAVAKFTHWQKSLMKDIIVKPSLSPDQQHIDQAVSEGVKSGIEELRNALKQEIDLLRQELKI